MYKSVKLCHVSGTFDASHILREASALLVQLRWAIPEPPLDERATCTGSHAFSFQANQSKSGEPIGHYRTLMKQNKRKELQSRREFFKKAAKGALPILGAIALANVPLTANASQVATSCNSYCSGTCKGSCGGACKGTCTGGCSGGCGSTCSGKCLGKCDGTCRSSCYSGSR